MTDHEQCTKCLDIDQSRYCQNNDEVNSGGICCREYFDKIGLQERCNTEKRVCTALNFNEDYRMSYDVYRYMRCPLDLMKCRSNLGLMAVNDKLSI